MGFSQQRGGVTRKRAFMERDSDLARSTLLARERERGLPKEKFNERDSDLATARRGLACRECSVLVRLS